MRTLKVFLLVAVLCLALPGSAGAAPAGPPETFAYYGDLTINATDFHRTFDDTWDLTRCDLQVIYTLDRQGLQGALVSSAPFANQSAPDQLNLNDKHNLMKPGSRDERDYDATSPDTVLAPFGTFEDIGIWYDRDGVGGLTNLPWGFVDKGNFNTAGKYRVSVTFHAREGSRTQGTMFATINNIATGFWPSDDLTPPPPHYPAGMSFGGQLSDVKAQVGLQSALAGYGQVKLTGISAVGCLAVRYYTWLPMLSRP
jgi:hypothetical protein